MHGKMLETYRPAICRGRMARETIAADRQKLGCYAMRKLMVNAKSQLAKGAKGLG